MEAEEGIERLKIEKKKEKKGRKPINEVLPEMSKRNAKQVEKELDGRVEDKMNELDRIRDLKSGTKVVIL